MWLFALFVAVPLIEIALFIQIGGFIGLWPTLLIVVLTAILGTILVRSQGRQAMQALQSSFSSLQDPSEPLAHGAMILFSGALLLTPGFFTDAVGFALLVPGIRKWLFAELRKRVQVQSFQMGEAPPQSRARPGPASGQTIDGEYEPIDETHQAQQNGPSGWTKDPGAH